MVPLLWMWEIFGVLWLVNRIAESHYVSLECHHSSGVFWSQDISTLLLCRKRCVLSQDKSFRLEELPWPSVLKSVVPQCTACWSCTCEVCLASGRSHTAACLPWEKTRTVCWWWWPRARCASIGPRAHGQPLYLNTQLYSKLAWSWISADIFVDVKDNVYI